MGWLLSEVLQCWCLLVPSMSAPLLPRCGSRVLEEGNGSSDGRRVNERKVGETDGKEGRKMHKSSPFTCLKASLLI